MAGCPVIPVPCIGGGATIGERGTIEPIDRGEKRGAPRVRDLVDHDVIALPRDRVDLNLCKKSIICHRLLCLTTAWT